MQRVAIAGLTAALLALFGSERRAQAQYFGRTTVSRSAAVRETDDFALRRSTDAGVSQNGAYRRTRSRAPVRDVHPQAPQVRRNYFPGLPTGQAPNRNYVDPSRLCVPGRRAFLSGR